MVYKNKLPKTMDMTIEEYIDNWNIGDLVARKEHGKLKYYIILDIRKKTKTKPIRVKMYNIDKQKFGDWKMFTLDHYRLANDWK